MGAYNALSSPVFSFMRHHPFISTAICGVAAAAAALAHSGGFIALFACLGATVLMWKNELDHPAATLLDIPPAA